MGAANLIDNRNAKPCGHRRSLSTIVADLQLAVRGYVEPRNGSRAMGADPFVGGTYYWTSRAGQKPQSSVCAMLERILSRM
jgi:hypothetical protein